MLLVLFFFFFKQKTAYEMRISDWSSDVCSSDLMHAMSLGDDPDRWVRMGERLPHDVLETFAVVGAHEEILAKLVARGSGVVRRYSVNTLGIDDADHVLDLARGLQPARASAEGPPANEVRGSPIRAPLATTQRRER